MRLNLGAVPRSEEPELVAARNGTSPAPANRKPSLGGSHRRSRLGVLSELAAGGSMRLRSGEIAPLGSVGRQRWMVEVDHSSALSLDRVA